MPFYQKVLHMYVNIDLSRYSLDFRNTQVLTITDVVDVEKRDEDCLQLRLEHFHSRWTLPTIFYLLLTMTTDLRVILKWFL